MRPNKLSGKIDSAFVYIVFNNFINLSMHFLVQIQMSEPRDIIGRD